MIKSYNYFFLKKHLYLILSIIFLVANTSVEVDSLSEELERYKEENRVQYEQLVSITSKLTDAESKIVKVSLILIYFINSYQGYISMRSCSL